MEYIDLSLESDLQYTVDKEPNVYLGHPTTTINNLGELLCVYPKGHGRGEIVYKKSFDYGITWSDRLETPESWRTSQETPIIYNLGDKIILLSGRYPSQLSYSLDNGINWTPFKKFNWGGLVVFSSLIEINNKYIAFFHDNGKFFQGTGIRGDFTLYQVTSSDGINWTYPHKIYVSKKGEKFCEPFAVFSTDKKEVTLLLRNNFKEYSYAMTSRDNCKSWGNPFKLNIHLSGDRHVSKYLPDGRLFISFRGKCKQFYHDWCAWVGTYEDIKQCRDGQYLIRIMKNMKSGGDCAYPGVELVDNTIITTTYGNWDESDLPFIKCVRLPVELLS